MSSKEDVEAPYSASFKTSPGFEAAQITVRGNTAEELLERLDELNEAGGFQAVVDFNNNLQAVNTASLPDEPAEEKEEKKSSRRSSGSSSRSSRGGSSRNSSRGSSRGGSSDRRSRSEIDEEDLHPDGLICGDEPDGKKGCKGRIHYKEIRDGEYKLWVCEFQRSRNDGHYSEFIND